ncbi:hypothetical protein AR679_gp168 [Yellowstone lake phycodnavirus 1]|uniref:hypothetical protein n=1 Tax=Yellowstone lake phycodnavirus 1 TaxID=1586713 RepID=UPI0006EBBE9A|nr:hypothetical protein AR679_gp168 [Yellowstone lake phycodnavirus 1]BAT22194.1 hypothetical protein [Yellowstone lake phycodnavirus 1]
MAFFLANQVQTLPSLTNMNRVYALQRVNTAYSGNIINLRRSTDSVTADFTMDPTNSFLVTASGGQTVAAWLGAGTANVATWYDQSGNARNLTQATAGLQPGFSTTTGVQFRSGLRMAFPDNGTITDVTFCAGFVQNAYLRGNAADPWYLQDGIIPNELGGAANDWGLLLPGAGKFGMAFGTSDTMNSISTNGLGNFSFMTATRVSATGSLTLYNGTGTGTNFTGMSTGSKNGSTPCYMGYNSVGNMQYMNADMASLFWFDDVKTTQFISSMATAFTSQIKPALNYQPQSNFYVTNGGSLIPMKIFNTPYYSFTTFNFTTLGTTGASGPTSLASYGTSYPGYGTSYALTLSGGMQLWKVPENGNYTITVAGAAGGSTSSTPTPGNGAIITLTTSLLRGNVIKILVGQSGTNGNNATSTGAGGGGGTFVYNNTTSILIAAAGGGGGASVISSGTYVSTMNGKNAQLANSGLSGYSNPSTQWTGGAGGTAGSGGGAGSDLYGGAGGGYSGNGVGGALAFLNGGTGVGKGGFGGGGTEGLGGGGGAGGYSGGGGGGANKDNLGGGGGGGGGSYDITGAYSGTLTNTGTGYVTITKL